jgi:hypothetical protein
LSQQQIAVARSMGAGGGRAAAGVRMEAGDAAQRDYVKAACGKSGCPSEAGLLAILRPAVSRM